MTRRRGFKRRPSFWADIEWKDGRIAGWVVECDDASHPIVARAADHEQAQSIIADLNAGRIDYRRAEKDGKAAGRPAPGTPE